jgi:hypothetical protein
MKPTAKQLDVLVGQAIWNTSFAGTIPASTGIIVTTAFAGMANGGSDAVAGVYTTAPQNKIYLRNRITDKAFEDGTTTARQIIGRLVYSSTVWTINFYTIQSGAEVAYNFTGNPDVGASFDFRWCESIQLKDASPTAVVDYGEGIDELEPSSPLMHEHQVDKFTATLNQTVFTASQTPKTSGELALFVNGIRYNYTTDYTVVTTTVTWLNTDFNLAAGDIITLVYAK